MPLDCGSLQGTVVNGELDNDAKAYVLCKHNEMRSKIALGNFAGANGNFAVATNMKRLRWDDKLAQVAQGWADQCTWQHNGNRGTEYNALAPDDIDGDPLNDTESVGENLSLKAASNVQQLSWQFAIDGFNAWVNEGQYYTIGHYGIDDQCSQSPCGHFTQLMWANTYKVGCAVKYCAANTLTTLAATYMVCDYASAGNYINQLPYDSGVVADDVCSTADLNQTVCRNGLTESETYQTGL